MSSPPLSTPLAVTALLLSRYLFFLTQRPISRSNIHYLHGRIEGLRSCAPVLASAVDPELSTAGRLLRGLTPANLREMAERLQLLLLRTARTDAPSGHVLANGPVPPDFVGGAREVRVIFGPAIGIGDEIICFPLPAWIKAANPAARVEVRSAYDGLWDGVRGVDATGRYTDLLELLAALRGSDTAGPIDLVLLVDFENPELYQLIAGDPAIHRYAELSIGARTLAAVDNGNRWIYRAQPIPGYRDNFYDALDWLGIALGIPEVALTERFDSMVRRRRGSRDGGFVIYVCPFTSKAEPALRYWTELLCSVLSPSPGKHVTVVIDPGANLGTRRFAGELRDGVAARVSGATVTVRRADADLGRALSVSGVFAQLGCADAVICADSFTAHAAPLQDCTTAVIARPELRNWRVPHPRHFSFDGTRPLPEIVVGIREILSRQGLFPRTDHQRHGRGNSERDLRAAAFALADMLGAPSGKADDLVAAHTTFVRARSTVLDKVSSWSIGERALLQDDRYDAELRTFDDTGARTTDQWNPVRDHITRDWLTWRNSNLCKYLAFAGGPQP